MLLHIPNVLSPDQLALCRERLERADWADGKITAGYQSAKAKRNQQLPQHCPEAQELGALVLSALEQNPLFIAAALPARIFPPLFNKYAPGMQFGAHVDNAIRQTPKGPRIRTDISATLFLTGPEDYEGGELVIEDSFGNHSVKLPAGDMVIYPASSLHHVTAVSEGCRIASFFWIESMVRSAADRALLFDMDLAIQDLHKTQADHPALIRLTGCYHNLLRRWATP